MAKKKQQHAYSHLNDEYWTTTAPDAVAAQPESQPVVGDVNEAQGAQGDKPRRVESDS